MGQRKGVQGEAEMSNWEHSSAPDGNELKLGPVHLVPPKLSWSLFYKVVRRCCEKACNCLESNVPLW